MVTLTSRGDIEAALADARLVPVPAEPGPGSGAGSWPAGSMAWLRATVARFTHGAVHARRRAYVEAELARIDVDGLRRLAGGAYGDGRSRVLRALAAAMRLELDDAAVAALCTVADNYFGGDDPAADDAVRMLLPLMQTDDAEQAANRIGILVQACDATTALIAAARDEHGSNSDSSSSLSSGSGSSPSSGSGSNLGTSPSSGSGSNLGSRSSAVQAALRSTPPVRIMRRIAIAATRIGAIEIAEGELVLLEVGPLGLTFGSGPRACPGRALALALAEGALAAR